MNRRGERLNWIDAFYGMKADYNAAKTGRFRRRRKGLPSMGSGADYHYRAEADYLRMIEIARDFDRNDLVTGQGITRLIDNVVLGGFQLDPDTGDKQLDLELWERWHSWAEDPDQCDLAGEHAWCSMEKLIPRHVVVDGDVCAVLTNTGKIEIVEAHRLRTPTRTNRNVVHGVLMDENRKRLEYWFTKDDVDPLSSVSKVGEMRRIPARDAEGFRQVLHLYRPKRKTQTRGVSAFAPIVDAVGMHDDIQFAQLLKQQIASCVVFLREQPVEGGPWGTASPQTGERTTEPLPDGSQRTIEGISPGLELTGRPGEKIQGFSPQITSPDQIQQVMVILSMIAANLNLPLPVFLLDPRQANFSSVRGALEQAKITYRDYQRWLTAYFSSPVYAWKVREWMGEDRALRAVSERQGVFIFRHRWNAPEQPYLEPLKDAQADTERLRGLHTSPRRLQAEYGRDWEEIIDETVADNGYAIRAAKAAAMELNLVKEGDPVSWRDLLSLQPPKVAAGAPAKPAGDGERREGEETEEEEPSGTVAA